MSVSVLNVSFRFFGNYASIPPGVRGSAVVTVGADIEGPDLDQGHPSGLISQPLPTPRELLTPARSLFSQGVRLERYERLSSAVAPVGAAALR